MDYFVNPLCIGNSQTFTNGLF